MRNAMRAMGITTVLVCADATVSQIVNFGAVRPFSVGNPDVAFALPGRPVSPATTQNQAGGMSAPAFHGISPGVERFAAPLAGVDVYVLRLTLTRRRIELRAIDDPLTQSASLARYVSDKKAIAGISGGFLRSYYPPLPTGRVVVSGRQLSPLVRDSLLNGIILIPVTGQLEIVSAASAAVAGASDSQLQTGPLLVMGGVAQVAASPGNASFWRLRRHRAFVAVDRKGRVLLGWTGPTSIPDLATALVNPSLPFLVRTAVALSGDVNAGIVLATKPSAEHRGDIQTPLHNALLVR